jgi:hypothetical protein
MQNTSTWTNFISLSFVYKPLTVVERRAVLIFRNLGERECKFGAPSGIGATDAGKEKVGTLVENTNRQWLLTCALLGLGGRLEDTVGWVSVTLAGSNCSCCNEFVLVNYILSKASNGQVARGARHCMGVNALTHSWGRSSNPPGSSRTNLKSSDSLLRDFAISFASSSFVAVLSRETCKRRQKKSWDE